jgi:hypothetical protein
MRLWVRGTSKATGSRRASLLRKNGTAGFPAVDKSAANKTSTPPDALRAPDAARESLPRVEG